MNKYYLRIILWTAVALWMAVIFAFSSETSAESTDTSDGIVDIIADILLENGDYSLPDGAFATAKERISFVVRKIAHFCSYMLLGVLTSSALYTHSLKRSVTCASAGAICVLYAVSDEIHQLFVPGRAGRVLDVLIDSAGAAVGILSLTLALYLLRKRKLGPDLNKEKNNGQNQKRI